MLAVNFTDCSIVFNFVDADKRESFEIDPLSMQAIQVRSNGHSDAIEGLEKLQLQKGLRLKLELIMKHKGVRMRIQKRRGQKASKAISNMDGGTSLYSVDMDVQYMIDEAHANPEGKSSIKPVALTRNKDNEVVAAISFQLLKDMSSHQTYFVVRDKVFDAVMINNRTPDLKVTITSAEPKVEESSPHTQLDSAAALWERIKPQICIEGRTMPSYSPRVELESNLSLQYKCEPATSGVYLPGNRCNRREPLSVDVSFAPYSSTLR